MRSRFGRLVTTVGAVVTGTMLMAQGGAGAVDPVGDPLYYFTGVVRDPVGRGVSAASVWDGSKSAGTDASGAYRLGERDFNRSFRLTASKTGMVAASRDVYVTAPVDTAVDFTLLYRTTVSLGDSTLSAASADASTTLTATSYAPNPGLAGETGGKSCVTVRDSATGVWQPAVAAGTNADGSVRWTWDLLVTAGSPERSGTLTARTLDCATSTVLAADVSTTYVVDNTAPTIADIQPGDGLNSATIASQYVTATIKDTGGAGVDGATIRFTVIDTTTLQSRTLTASYNPSTGRAQAGPITLALRNRHRVEATVTDRSGNSASFGHRSADDNGGVLAMTVTPVAVTTDIPRVSCTLGTADVVKNTRSVTCSGAVLNVADTSVSLSGTTHEGAGFVDVNAPLHLARIEYTVATTPQSTNAYAAGTTKWVPLKYQVEAESETDVTVPATGRTVSLAPVTATLPALATDATLVMNPAAVLPAVPVCSSPTTVSGSVRCNSDPLNTGIVVITKPNVDAAAVAQRHEANYGITVKSVETDRYFAYASNGYATAIRGDGDVAAVARDVEFDYVVSGRQIVKHDITNTPQGQAAIQATPSAGEVLHAYDLSAASGLGSDGTASDIFVWPASRTSAISSVYSLLSGVTGRHLDFGPSLSLGGSSPNRSRGSGSWQNAGGECFGRFQDDYSYIHPCWQANWLSGDPEAAADGWNLLVDATGGSLSSTRRLKTLLIRIEPVTPGMSWDGVNRYAPTRDETSTNCTEVSGQIGLSIKVFEVGFGVSRAICDTWDITTSATPGWFQNTFRARWPYLGRGHDENVSALVGVKAPPGEISWRVTYGFSHT